MRPYVLVAPDFDPTSGGIRVMWGLFGALLAKGQIAFMNRTPGGEVIAIYPEIIHDNPANSPHVVRYLLNKPGFMSSNGVPGPTIFSKDDIIVSFSKVFEENPNMFMFLPILNLHLFKDQGKKRTKKAVFFGKSRGNLHPKDCIEIDRNSCTDQQALSDLLNECEVLYIYDQVTAMSEIARLCGCRVVYFPWEVTEEEYQKYEPGMNGISWGEDKHIPLDTEAFTEAYRGLQKKFWNESLEEFIELTQ